MTIVYSTLPSALASVKNGIAVIGITGRAGAGKTSKVAPGIATIANEMGLWSATLSLDAFFILSSEERAEWLAEGIRLGPEEAARRRDQMTWWNFERLEEVLQTLKCGHPVHLRNVYNRADRGRLTGEINLIPPKGKPGVLSLEGVAIVHLKSMDRLFYVHAPSDVRFARLCKRDIYRAPEEMRTRFQLTEEFESKYFSQHKNRLHHWIDNSSHNGDHNDLSIYTGMDGIL
ncbi:MAG: hypothetical protein A3J58_01860 [Candidatus Sungbacteria bacterium RIFCSPHIGHO2_02_FULL_52_23]|uniref:Phosphoribulokinase/uridine kinase domain-containing protein n=1 Tax=Candidatus Sungbacteria bacterium RIFCSPHIGHO2_02_FULL_52_23 TaxID=1802274 RepID=A0A1G2KV97_9BACT|nr:MAG: hypothetical protein A3J58_01860 [Candidatus Sungbacteria bacterium RIFCSPHIGHO2_02_FULL_52_23]